MSYVDRLQPEDVTDPQHFAWYIEQELGVPWTSNADLTILKKKIKEFFGHYPQLDYLTLVHVVAFCKAKKKRYGTVWRVMDQVRWAYEAGFAPELDTRLTAIDLDLERGIAAALEVEQDPTWRSRLLASAGSGRRDTLGAWLNEGKELV